MFDALAQYLLDASETILQRWRAEVRRDASHPATRCHLDAAELDDHLPALLRMLATCLRDESPEAVEKQGAEHGHQRRRRGYSVTELLSEMSSFRRVLMATIEAEFQNSRFHLDEESLAAARLRILDLLDRSVHASVRQFMREAEAERDEARTHVADATARLEDANAALQEAHVQKDRFLSVLSHELRNPLASIVMAVEVLKRLVPEHPSARAQLAIVERQSRHLGRLVDDLLNLNRIAHGKLELRPEVMSLQTAVTFAVDSRHAAFAEKGVPLSVELPPEPVRVFADGTRLSQVVMNLLDNALKFTPPGGSVTVSLATHGTEAVLRVRDTGAGIPREMLSRVFEPFEQADTTAAHAGGGLGLGLMIARDLVEAQGGSIAADSAGPGRGAELVVRLPVAANDADRERARGGLRPRSHEGGRRR